MNARMTDYQTCRQRLLQRLLQERSDNGAWEGRLSSSALSTALACLALTRLGRTQDAARIQNGLAYLQAQQCADGSWGDTDNSPGNISTSLLVWACMRVQHEQDVLRDHIARVEAWIRTQVGSLEPDAICRHVRARYGRDKTFAVPIMMACAQAGCLGSEPRCWRLVQQLPFELAALPRAFYAALRLPVVSYALPALIAIGVLRHNKRPSWLLPMRWLRNLLRKRCLQKLHAIQPENGGFLEATPLTAFVVMALDAAGHAQLPAVQRAHEFLIDAQRSDGSWPIDTNLSTWVTSLSLRALPDDALTPADKTVLCDWYVQQQYRDVHPYTGANPGGWAWAPLPGAVPDADDTSGALLALHRLGCRDMQVIEGGLCWLLKLQNSDGGMPTFCRGWANLPFDRSCADISAHAYHACSVWLPQIKGPLRRRVLLAIKRLYQYLERSIGDDGEWRPLWFGSQRHAAGDNPVFGSARVVAALTAVPRVDPESELLLQRGIHYLLHAQLPDASWGAAPGVDGTVEETALVIEALSAHAAADPRIAEALELAVDWLCQQWQNDVEPQPIGLYFANLWYYERLYPLSFSLAALNAWHRVQEHR